MAHAVTSRATEPTTDDERRLPPHDLDAEMSVLGAMMMRPEIIPDVVEVHLLPADFYSHRNGVIYQAIMGLHSEDGATDLIAVRDRLQRDGKLENAGGAGHLGQIAAFPTAASNAPHHATIVHDHAILRALIDAGQEIVRLGHERGATTEQLVAQAKALLEDIPA